MTQPVHPENWPPDWPDIIDPAVRAALSAVPRHLFVPTEQRADAYQDIALPIGHGQTISQPYIVALMTQVLSLTAESRVLEIGTGCGYQAAVLAEITPHVWSIETQPELAEEAAGRLRALGYPVEVRIGDGCLGWPELAPFDAVIVTAVAPEVPPRLVAQLADGGRLVIPLGEPGGDQRLWLIEKPAGDLIVRYLTDVRFVPLIASCDTPATDPSLDALRRQLVESFASWRF
jgi:protein-L-isoaspartate(D-aspartate) O-methyltransferase